MLKQRKAALRKASSGMPGEGLSEGLSAFDGAESIGTGDGSAGPWGAGSAGARRGGGSVASRRQRQRHLAMQAAVSAASAAASGSGEGDGTTSAASRAAGEAASEAAGRAASMERRAARLQRQEEGVDSELEHWRGQRERLLRALHPDDREGALLSVAGLRERGAAQWEAMAAADVLDRLASTGLDASLVLAPMLDAQGRVDTARRVDACILDAAARAAPRSAVALVRRLARPDELEAPSRLLDEPLALLYRISDDMAGRRVASAGPKPRRGSVLDALSSGTMTRPPMWHGPSGIVAGDGAGAGGGSPGLRAEDLR